MKIINSHLSSLHFLIPFVIKKKIFWLAFIYIYIYISFLNILPSRKLANMVLLKNINKKVGSFDATPSHAGMICRCLECDSGYFLRYFYSKIYQNSIFIYFLRIIFNINILKRCKNIKKLFLNNFFLIFHEILEPNSNCALVVSWCIFKKNKK